MSMDQGNKELKPQKQGFPVVTVLNKTSDYATETKACELTKEMETFFPVMLMTI